MAGKDQKKAIKRKAPGERVPRAKKVNNRLKKKQEEEEDWFPQVGRHVVVSTSFGN